MRYIIAVLGVLLLLMVLWDAFEVIILPRRITRRFRFARFFYRFSWRLRLVAAHRMRNNERRENYLSIFGPLSLLLLLDYWAVGLVGGFTMLHWGLRIPLNVVSGSVSFGTYVYLSGTTLFTLGIGDVTPLSALGRALVIVESGVGFGFLAAVISYLPILYQAFSRREVSISLLDARAGSPPSAGEFLRRHGQDMPQLDQLLCDWERWSAELLESHLSYPVLAYFRSQHTGQSWLAAVTTILDVCALIMTGTNGAPKQQAHLTFAMARHVVVDLAQIFINRLSSPMSDRLPPSSFTDLRDMLSEARITLLERATAEQELRELRQMYEPYVQGLSEYLWMPLPAWFRVIHTPDSWQTGGWM